MRKLAHGYTNETVGDGHVVIKTYNGPDAQRRREWEVAILRSFADDLPLPPLLGAEIGTLRLGFVDGTHGQELLEPGRSDTVAASVLAACGTTLARVHAVDITALPASGALGSRQDRPSVLVHGDFGPNNVLLRREPPSDRLTVVAILDWEFARIGHPVDDLAWCEWIIRTHHPDRVNLLDAFFDAYGAPVPTWPERQAAMVARCEALIEFCDRWEPGGGDLWRQRVQDVQSWHE